MSFGNQGDCKESDEHDFEFEARAISMVEYLVSFIIIKSI